MPNNNRQGKWQPFDALEGFQKAIRQVESEKSKVSKPILFPDELEKLNNQLIAAFENQTIIKIIYYYNGYFKEIEGVVNKIDDIQKEIIIDSQRLKFDLIIKIVD